MKKVSLGLILAVNLVVASAAASADSAPTSPVAESAPDQADSSANGSFDTQPSPGVANRYTLFESGHVRPLARSPDGERLFAVNTPAATLEVFQITQNQLQKVASIPVGLEPVAVAARNNHEVWVVNHLSDSISIVDVRNGVMRVVRTLLVGDEPRDIVFAGAKRARAFVTTAHRGQNVPFDPQFTTPGVGRADVWVFDALTARQDQGSSLGGTPLNIITLFTDTPRALAVSSDGSRVYAAGYLTGNRTTVVPDPVVRMNGGLPPPLTNFEGIPQPSTALIVKYDGEHWRDELDRSWNAHVMFSLPDKDVFVIDALADPPRLLAGSAGFYSGVGTVLFNMTVNPKSGRVYVANTEAINEPRFEGMLSVDNKVQGHLHESRITVLDGSGKVAPRHLNKHIDYSVCCLATPNSENQRSLAFPMDMAVTGDGNTLYVAAFGSSKVGVFATDQLENDTFAPDEANQITVSGGGPSGLVLDEARETLYVLTRFNNSIAIVNTRNKAQIASVTMPNPEPQAIVEGRKLFYDASLSSSHGDSSCASCHVFGDFDALAWDLGNPNAQELNNPGPFTKTPASIGSDLTVHFRPMKGPMVTQSLRGMANHGPMHWRGDRTGGNDAASAQPDSGTFDEQAAFKKFNPAFVELLGRHDELTEQDMQHLTDFALQIVYPPNPVRNLDNSLNAAQQAGRDFYFDLSTDPAPFNTCNSCHVLDPAGNAEFGVARPGFFGTEGKSSFDGVSQVFKIQHFRNLYQKVGMFGRPPTGGPLPPPENPDGSNNFMGDQIRGFGFTNDGSTDTIFRFVQFTGSRDPALPNSPDNPGFTAGPQADVERRQLEQFLLAYPSNMAPIVGQQITLSLRNSTLAGPRIDLLLARADAGECDLVATRASNRRGYLYAGSGMFYSSVDLRSKITEAALRSEVKIDGIETTYTCTPLGSGLQLAFARANESLDTLDAFNSQVMRADSGSSEIVEEHEQ